MCVLCDLCGEQISSHFEPKFDEAVKSQKAPVIVTPVKTGIPEDHLLTDSRSPIGIEDRLRGVTALETFYETIKIIKKIIKPT